MKWLLIAGAVLVLVALVVVAVGAALPRDHVASREVTVGAPPDAVWAVITDIDGFPGWRKDVARVERLPDQDGRPVWIEHSSSDRMTLAVDRSEPPRQLVVRIADPNLPFGGTWTYEITAAPGGSTLRITERGEVYNPVFRFVARFIMGHEGTISKYLDAFDARMQKETGGSRGL